MPKLILNKDLFLQALAQNKNNQKLNMSAIADEMGINRSYLFKVLTGKQNPGRKFIEGTLKVCKGYSMNDLFTLNGKSTLSISSREFL